ncbi:hypothetical protein D3C72_2214570 [compost metagenome]
MLEILNHIERRRGGLISIEVNEIIGEVVGVFAAPQMIRPQPAIQHVRTGIAGQ